MTPLFDGLSGQSLVVTGGTGFLGSAFVRHAVGAGARATVLSRASSDHWRLGEAKGRYLNVTTTLDKLAGSHLMLPSASVMVHFAAAGVNQSIDDVADAVATNVAGTASALMFARQHELRRFVLVGSSGEYGPGVSLVEDAALRPTSVYGATRASATLLARAFGTRHGLDVVVVRPFAVFGPYEAAYRLIPHTILSALRGQPIRISSGQQTRDYVHVDDISAGIARACVVEEAHGGTFNLCSGIETPVLEAARLVARLVGSDAQVEAGTVPAIPGEMWRTSGDPSRARGALGWSASTDLAAGLAQTIEWFRATGLSLPAYNASPL